MRRANLDVTELNLHTTGKFANLHVTQSVREEVSRNSALRFPAAAIFHQFLTQFNIFNRYRVISFFV